MGQIVCFVMHSTTTYINNNDESGKNYFVIFFYQLLSIIVIGCHSVKFGSFVLSVCGNTFTFRIFPFVVCNI